MAMCWSHNDSLSLSRSLSSLYSFTAKIDKELLSAGVAAASRHLVEIELIP